VVEVTAERRIVGVRDAGRGLGVRPAWESRYVWQLVVLDLGIAFAAGGLAFLGRFGNSTEPHTLYLWLSALLPVAWLASLGLNRAYDTRFLFVGTEEYQRVFRAAFAMVAAIAIASYSLGLSIARGYLAIAIPAALAGLGAARSAMRHVLHDTWAAGLRLRRVLAIGHPSDVADLCAMLRRSRYHGLEVVAACLPTPVGNRDDRVPVPIHGAFDDIPGAVSAAQADTVVVLSCPELNGATLRRLSWTMEDEKIDVIVASALLDVAGDRTTIRPVDGLPMLHLDRAAVRGPRRLIKDAFDRVVALLLIVVLSPVLLACAAVIRVTSSGPVLFHQVRVGRDGREFRILKFRTMHLGSERLLAEIVAANDNDGVLFKMREDPRVTPVGRVLRRYSLDELPQLMNVLVGDMSLVGPRPPLPAEVEQYPVDMRRRLVVKPGMTGLWQVSGRSDLPWDEVMRLDLRYVENWSLSFDLIILLRTITAVVRSSGAY
jgi:exopolysaccharide biosynthesis polyprenyl glycosylphosphotransferase